MIKGKNKKRTKVAGQCRIQTDREKVKEIKKNKFLDKLKALKKTELEKFDKLTQNDSSDFQSQTTKEVVSLTEEANFVLNNSEEDKLLVVLKQSGLEKYYSNFVKEEVDFNALFYLKEDDFDRLLPTLGAKRKFLAVINKYV